MKKNKYGDRIITLKTRQPFFDMSYNGLKPFEIRYNDRDFKVGDRLELVPTDENDHRIVYASVISVVDFPDGLRAGYVCLGLDNMVSLV